MTENGRYVVYALGAPARHQAPPLLVRGRLSPIMPAEMAERMAVEIPQATLVTMQGLYHHLVLDAPEAFSRILDDFLRELPG